MLGRMLKICRQLRKFAYTKITLLWSLYGMSGTNIFSFSVLCMLFALSDAQFNMYVCLCVCRIWWNGIAGKENCRATKNWNFSIEIFRFMVCGAQHSFTLIAYTQTSILTTPQQTWSSTIAFQYACIFASKFLLFVVGINEFLVCADTGQQPFRIYTYSHIHSQT